MSKPVFFIIGQLGKGGAERQLLNLVKGLTEQGVNHSVFVWSTTAKSDMLQLYTAILNERLVIAHHRSIVKRFIALVMHLYKVKPGAIVSFTNYTNIIAFLCGILTFRKTYGSVRNSLYIKKPFFVKARSLIMTFSPRIISNNKASIRYIKQHFPFIRTNHLPNSVDFTTQFYPLIKEFDSISIGSLKKEKRIDRLFEFVKEMSRLNPFYKHVHIGGGELLNQYIKTIQDTKLDHNLIFRGQVDNVTDYINKSSLLLHFSEFEGTPNAVMEAMASRKPVVSTNCGDVKELVDSGVNGFVIDDYSTAEFIEKVTWCLAGNNLDKFGEQSYLKIKQFTIAQTVNRFLEIIR